MIVFKTALMIFYQFTCTFYFRFVPSNVNSLVVLVFISDISKLQVPQFRVDSHSMLVIQAAVTTVTEYAFIDI